MGIRVLVCGSRNYPDRQKVFSYLDSLHLRSHIEVIIEGEARGVDLMAKEWAIENNVPVRAFPANWRLHHKAAGPIRNCQMLEEGKPDICVAFPTGGNLDNTKGTRNMVTQARQRGVIIHVVQP